MQLGQNAWRWLTPTLPSGDNSIFPAHSSKRRKALSRHSPKDRRLLSTASGHFATMTRIKAKAAIYSSAAGRRRPARSERPTNASEAI